MELDANPSVTGHSGMGSVQQAGDLGGAPMKDGELPRPSGLPMDINDESVQQAGDLGGEGGDDDEGKDASDEVLATPSSPSAATEGELAMASNPAIREAESPPEIVAGDADAELALHSGAPMSLSMDANGELLMPSGRPVGVDDAEDLIDL